MTTISNKGQKNEKPKVIATFIDEYGYTRNIYAGVDKIASKRLSEAKIKYMKMEIDNDDKNKLQ